MAIEPDVRVLLESYLLGRAAEQDVAMVEERYFLDDAYFDMLEILEEDLIGRYLRDELPAADRQSFEEAYLVSEDRRRKVREQRELMETVVAMHQRDRAIFPRVGSFLTARDPLPRWGLALAGLSLLVAGLLVRGRITTMVDRLEASRREAEDRDRTAQTERARREAAEGRLSRLTTPHFSLIPGVTRSATQGLLIPAGTDAVSLQFATERAERHGLGRVVLQNASGQVVWSQNLTPLDATPAAGITVTLPGRVLPPGDYSAALSGGGSATALRTIASYSFRVETP